MIEVGVGLSEEQDTATATAAAAEQAMASLPGHCTLAVVFATPGHDLSKAVAEIEHRCEPTVLLGAVSSGVIAGGREVEGGPAVAVWCAALPGVGVLPLRSWALPRPEGGVVVAGWPDADAADTVLLLADPRSYPIGEVLRAVPAARVVGGLVSEGLALGTEVHDDGAVGVVLSGLPVEVCVSPGCRPIGVPWVVTRAEGAALIELAGAPALHRLRELFVTADAETRAALRRGLLVGVVVDEYRDEFGPGDFLVRPVLGADPASGAVVVGEPVEVGRTVQFCVLDADTAHEELCRRLGAIDPAGAAGALVFCCNGRGRHLFGVRDHDAALVQQRLRVPIAGVFCGGEIGPVGDRCAVHGYTASLAVLRRA